MARRKYKFTNKNHAVGGIISTFMGLLSLALFSWSIVMSFQARGEGGTLVGTVALTSLAVAVFGCAIGLLSYREIDKYYTFSFSGSLMNGIMAVVMVLLLLVGI